VELPQQKPKPEEAVTTKNLLEKEDDDVFYGRSVTIGLRKMKDATKRRLAKIEIDKVLLKYED
jgi:hypothetical protein